MDEALTLLSDIAFEALWVLQPVQLPRRYQPKGVEPSFKFQKATPPVREGKPVTQRQRELWNFMSQIVMIKAEVRKYEEAGIIGQWPRHLSQEKWTQLRERFKQLGLCEAGECPEPRPLHPVRGSALCEVGD